MTPDRVICPRCGESLPATLDVCDACGAELGQTASRAVPAPPARPAGGSRPVPRTRTDGTKRDAIPGIAWLLLVVGLAVGGMVGFALHSAVGPRAESGMPQGPADIMAGNSGAPEGGSGMGGAPGGAPQSMPAPVMQMVQGFKQALAKNPKDKDALIGLANLATGQNDLARKELLRVTKERPTHVNAWLNLGVVNRELGDRAGAIAAW